MLKLRGFSYLIWGLEVDSARLHPDINAQTRLHRFIKRSLQNHIPGRRLVVGTSRTILPYQVMCAITLSRLDGQMLWPSQATEFTALCLKTKHTVIGVNRHSNKHAPRNVPEAQYAFKDLMIHWILQFTLRIAFRCVLHRCGSQDILCWKSCVTLILVRKANLPTDFMLSFVQTIVVCIRRYKLRV